MSATSVIYHLNRGVQRVRSAVDPQHTYQRELVFIATIGICGYFCLALLSFNPYDPSPFSASFPEAEITNLTGRFGATVSAYMFFIFGIVAFILPVPFIISSLLALTQRRPYIAWGTFSGWSGAVLSILCMTTLITPETTIENLPFATGGYIGDSLASWTVSLFGTGGSWILLLTILICSSIAIMRESVIVRGISKARGYVPDVKKPAIPWNKALFWRKSNVMASAASLPLIPINEPTKREIFSAPAPVTEPVAYEPVQPPTSTTYTPRPASADYEPPPSSIFRTTDANEPLNATQKYEFEQTAKLLTTTFDDFGITGKVVAIQPGPVVTVFEFQPNAGTKLSKMTGLIDDLALSLRVDSIFLHPVRGKRAIGVQVPNSSREVVTLGDVIQSAEYQNCASPLTLALGKSIAGEPMCADLTKMPHLLMAGATGAGKSVAINALLCSIIMKASPEQVRMLLVDPKMLELSVYEGIPHLLMPVITDAGRASLALKWATKEMERRYRLMQFAQVRHIAGFNEFWKAANNHERQNFMDLTGEEHVEELPYILLVIDELADLMMMAPKDVEASIQRLAQKARASGIHLVLATQRPSVDIITGVIKANLPCRAAFQVVSKHDSRTILDQNGADKLLGQGDMLMMRPGITRLERIQGAFISDEEVIGMVQAVKESAKVTYDKQLINWMREEEERQNDSDQDLGATSSDDPKFEDALNIARSNGAISASFLQRHLKIGYNRAARIVDTMEAQGLVAPADGVKPRQWLGQ